jgi:hypothetical protein
MLNVSGMERGPAASASQYDTIHRLSVERGQLQTRLVRHPWSDREAAARIQALTTELEACRTEVRRSRAARRVRMEEALGGDPAASQKTDRPTSKPAAHQTERRQPGERLRVPQAYSYSWS